MSSHTSSRAYAYKTNNHPIASSTFKPISVVSAIVIIISMALFSTGCSTTQEFKPTASVIAGGHKSI